MSQPILYRQYTLTCEKDINNVIHNGICPDYALSWSDEFNTHFWPFNHDFKGPTYKKRKLNRELLCGIQDKLTGIFTQYKNIRHNNDILNIFMDTL